MIRRIAIAVVGATMVGMAFGLVKPDLLLSFIGFSISNPAEAAYQLGEVRAVYGGLFLVIGAFTLLSAVDLIASRARLVLLGWCWLGLGGGRLVGDLVDGDPGLWGWLFIVGELGAGVLVLACTLPTNDASSAARTLA